MILLHCDDCSGYVEQDKCYFYAELRTPRMDFIIKKYANNVLYLEHLKAKIVGKINCEE